MELNIQNISLNNLEEVVYYDISIIMWMNAALSSNIYSFIYCVPIDTCLAWRSSLGAALVIYLSILLDCHYILPRLQLQIPGQRKHILNIFPDNILLLAATQKFATNTCKSK